MRLLIHPRLLHAYVPDWDIGVGVDRRGLGKRSTESSDLNWKKTNHQASELFISLLICQIAYLIWRADATGLCLWIPDLSVGPGLP